MPTLTGELQTIDAAEMPLSWAAQAQRLKPPRAA